MSALAYLISLQRKSTVYDVGANIGLHARFAVQRFGASQVVAFEPMQSNVEQLMANVNLADLQSKVRVIRCALSDREGTEELQVDDMQSASASLDRVTGGEPAEGRARLGLRSKTEEVETRRLDTVVSTHDLSQPDVVKIDVEGAERLVLEGASRLLSEHRPHLIVETHGAQAARDVLSLLFDFDYHIAANVEGSLRRNGEWHRRVRPCNVPEVENKYDVRFVLATSRLEDLPEALPKYSVE